MNAQGPLAGAAVVALVAAGERVGLFSALAESPAVSADGLACRAGLSATAVAGWLAAMTAAGVVEHDGLRGTYALGVNAQALHGAGGTRETPGARGAAPLAGSFVDDGTVARGVADGLRGRSTRALALARRRVALRFAEAVTPSFIAACGPGPLLDLTSSSFSMSFPALLDEARRALAPGGRLLVAAVRISSQPADDEDEPLAILGHCALAVLGAGVAVDEARRQLRVAGFVDVDERPVAASPLVLLCARSA